MRIAAYLLVILMVGLGGLEPPTSPLSVLRSLLPEHYSSRYRMRSGSRIPVHTTATGISNLQTNRFATISKLVTWEHRSRNRGSRVYRNLTVESGLMGRDGSSAADALTFLDCDISMEWHVNKPINSARRFWPLDLKEIELLRLSDSKHLSWIVTRQETAACSFQT